LLYDKKKKSEEMKNCSTYFDGYCNSCNPCSTYGENNVLLDSFAMECSNTDYGPQNTNSCMTIGDLMIEAGALSSGGNRSLHQILLYSLLLLGLVIALVEASVF
jgi:hypothetical protein